MLLLPMQTKHRVKPMPIVGTVKIDGRPLHAGEFGFGVKYANGGDDLLSAKNEADGTIDFGKLSFTVTSLDELAQNGIAEKTTIDGVPAWIVYYLVHEKTSGLSDVGVTPHTAPVSLIVTVKDEGNGALSASFRTANELRFDNTYSTGEPVHYVFGGNEGICRWKKEPRLLISRESFDLLYRQRI